MSVRDGFDRLSQRSLSRRDFLGRAGLVTGGLLVLGPGGLLRAGSASAQEKAILNKRAFVAGSFMLSLDGQPAGFVQSFEGGMARGAVATQAGGTSLLTKKAIASVVYEPIKFRAPVGSMSPQFWSLLGGMLSGDHKRMNGEIAVADFSGAVQRRVVFQNALVSELNIPALDGASKEMAYVDVTLAPEHTSMQEGGGAKVGTELMKTAQKRSLLANFRLSIDGLEQACKRVSKVEALVVKQSVQTDAIGSEREFMRAPGKIEIPNLVFTVPVADAAELQKWHKDFVIDGNNGDDKERGGTLELLTPDLASSLLVLKFSNLGIFALSPVAAAAGSDAVARMQAELYCESLSLEVPLAKV